MGKILAILYGVFNYLMFLATFLYLIAFVGNFDNLPYVTKTIDSGEAGPLGYSLIVNIALIGLFASTHTIMARPWFKKHWVKIIPKSIERSTYVLVSNACLIILFIYWQPIPELVWQTTNSTWIYVLWAVFLGGYGIVVLSTFLINHFELFGLTHVYANFMGTKIPSYKFVQPLLYKMVRHPLYFGFILGFWSTPMMSAGHLLFATLLTAQILVSIPYEEKDIEAELGDPYKDYVKRTPMLFPFVKIKG